MDRAETVSIQTICISHCNNELLGHCSCEEEHLLLDRLLKGDMEAFGKLWLKYHRYYYNLCLKWMAGNHADAEDALSKAMLKALNKLRQQDVKINNIKSWLTRLIFNLCVDIHRERKRLKDYIEELPEKNEVFIDLKESPEQDLLISERYLRLHLAIESLPGRLRAPFLLRVFNEMSYQEIAIQLNISNENARKRVQQARLLLRKAMAKYYAKPRDYSQDEDEITETIISQLSQVDIPPAYLQSATPAW
ncbi:MAG: RNA polymerase sigma factor [Acidobacteriota bacterium]